MFRRFAYVLAIFGFVVSLAVPAVAKPLYCQYQCEDWSPGDYNYHCTCPQGMAMAGLVTRCSGWFFTCDGEALTSASETAQSCTIVEDTDEHEEEPPSKLEDSVVEAD